MTEWTKESKANYDWLMESKEQLKNGQYAEHDLIDVEEVKAILDEEK